MHRLIEYPNFCLLTPSSFHEPYSYSHFFLCFANFFLGGTSQREDRYRSSRHEDRDGHREHRGDRDRDRYGGDRDRDGHRDRRDGRDRRDRYNGGGRDHEDHGRHTGRYDDDKRRKPRDDDFGPPRGRDDGQRGDKRRGSRRDSTERLSPIPEGCLPLSQRKRKASGWDVHAPGYEQYTAMQAKQTGAQLLLL